MYRSESFQNILTSKNFQLQDEEQQQALAETFSKVIDGYLPITAIMKSMKFKVSGGQMEIH